MPENVLAALSNNPIAQRKNILHIFQLRFELRQFRWQQNSSLQGNLIGFNTDNFCLEVFTLGECCLPPRVVTCVWLERLSRKAKRSFSVWNPNRSKSHNCSRSSSCCGGKVLKISRVRNGIFRKKQFGCSRRVYAASWQTVIHGSHAPK